MNQAHTLGSASMNASMNASAADAQPQSLMLRAPTELTIKLESITELVEGLSAATHIAHGLSDGYILAEPASPLNAHAAQNANDALQARLTYVEKELRDVTRERDAFRDRNARLTTGLALARDSLNALLRGN